MAHHCYLDGSNFIMRAYHIAKSRPRLRKSDQVDFAATHLYANMLMRLVEQMHSGRRPPTHMAIFFDPDRETTWRKKEFPAYKAKREATPADLKAQLPYMHNLCDAMGVPWALEETFEADDLLARYVLDASEQGNKVSIMSGDKDLMQLVKPGVIQYNDMTKTWFKQADVEAKFEVPITRVADFLAMAGDNTDGIPGVAGIGKKYAVLLLNKYGSLEHIISDPSIIEEDSLRKKVEKGVEAARLSLRMTVLTGEGVPKPLSEDQMKVGPDPDMRERVTAWLSEQTD